MEDVVKHVQIFIETSMAFTGLFENVVVLVLFFQDRHINKPHHMYIISLAVSDLLVTFKGPYFIAKYLAAPKVLLAVINGLMVAGYLSSFLNIVLTAVDRFWATNFVFHYRVFASKNLIRWLICITWNVSLSFGMFIVYVFLLAEVNLPLAQRMSQLYMNAVFLGIVPFSLLLTIVAYLQVYLQIRKSRQLTISDMIQIVRAETPDAAGKQLKATILLVFIVVFFILCWTPGCVMTFIRVVFPSLPYAPNAVVRFINMLSTLNSLLNPFFYVFHIPRARLRIKRILCCRCDRIPQSPDSTTAS